MRKHCFVFVRLEKMPREIPLYKCKYCGTEKHATLYEITTTAPCLAKCSKSPVRASWWELLKGKIDCAYNAKDRR